MSINMKLKGYFNILRIIVHGTTQKNTKELLEPWYEPLNVKVLLDYIP